MKKLANQGTSELTLSVTGTGNLYINGVKKTSPGTIGVTPSANGTIVQVILQDGTAAPYITWIALYSGAIPQ